MSGDVRFVRQHPLESFVHAQKMKRMVTNMHIRWLSCACPFCPVYLLLLFAIHSLDVRGSYVVQSVDWNLIVNATHKPDIKRTFNGETQDTSRIYTGHDE